MDIKGVVFCYNDLRESNSPNDVGSFLSDPPLIVLQCKLRIFLWTEKVKEIDLQVDQRKKVLKGFRKDQ